MKDNIFRKFRINLAALIFLTAFTYQFSINWADYGFTQESKTEEENNFEYTLKKGGKTITVKSMETIPETVATDVAGFVNKTLQFQFIRYDAITFLYKNGTLDVSLIPITYSYEGTDYVSIIPAGIQFMLEKDTVQYNFRIKKDAYFVKIKGDFVDDSLISEKLKKAAANPALYIKQRDPEFIANKLEQLEEEMDSLKTQSKRLENENNLLKYALMAFHNKGFLGSEKPVPEEKIRAVLDYKKKFPKATREQVEEEMEKQKLEISSREIKIIFFVYFNEFDKE